MPKGNYGINHGGNGCRGRKLNNAKKKYPRNWSQNPVGWKPPPKKTRIERYPTPKATRFYEEQVRQVEEKEAIAWEKSMRELYKELKHLNGNSEWQKRQKARREMEF